MNIKQPKYTIKDFDKQFPDDDACLEYLKITRFLDGIFCKSCGKVTNHSKLSNLPVYSCNRCGSHTHPMVGTIFENSRTSLRQWFYAMFLMSSTRCGISAKQLQRELGVTYKTAWRMFKQIRQLMNEQTPKLSGIVEIDEMYVGGKRENGNLNDKTPVIGAVQRKGNIKTGVIKTTRSSSLAPFIIQNINQRTTLLTDEYSGYNNINKCGYIHKTINHQEAYAIENIHTNNIEGFWSLVKRGISGVYHSVSPEYLQSYVNEYAFRYNHRKDNKPMFKIVLEQI
jgi:transposase